MTDSLHQRRLELWCCHWSIVAIFVVYWLCKMSWNIYYQILTAYQLITFHTSSSWKRWSSQHIVKT